MKFKSVKSPKSSDPFGSQTEKLHSDKTHAKSMFVNQSFLSKPNKSPISNWENSSSLKFKDVRREMKQVFKEDHPQDQNSDFKTLAANAIKEENDE